MLENEGSVSSAWEMAAEGVDDWMRDAIDWLVAGVELTVEVTDCPAEEGEDVVVGVAVAVHVTVVVAAVVVEEPRGWRLWHFPVGNTHKGCYF